MLLGGSYTPLNIIPQFWGKPPVIKVNQFDEELTEMGFTVWNGKDQMELAGISAVIIGKKPDGTVFAYTCTVNTSENTITVPVKEQMTAVPGKVVAELALTNTDQEVVHTWNFGIWVEKAVSEDGGTSESDIAAFQEILTEAQGLEAAILQAAEDAEDSKDAAARSKEAAANSAAAAERSAEEASRDYTRANARITVLETGRVYIDPDDGLFYYDAEAAEEEEEED